MKQLTALLPKPITDREEARCLSNEAAQISHDKNILIESRDKQISEITDSFGARIARLKKQYDAIVDKILNWARANREQEFGGKQRLILDGNLIKFTKGKGKVEFRPDGGKPLRDIDATKAILAIDDEELWELALNTKPSLDKIAINALISDPDDEQGKILRQLGFTITKDEALEFEPASIDS